MPFTIFIIDNDEKLQAYLKENLELQGYKVEQALDTLEAIDLLKKSRPRLIIMEIVYKNLKEDTALLEVKKAAPNVPVIVLTENKDTNSLVKAFNLGVNDYVVKPFEFPELCARIRARLNSVRKPTENIVTYRDLEIDTLKKLVYKKGKYIKTSAKEYELLYFLVSNKGTVFSRDTLLERVWNMEKLIVTRTVDVYIGRLRRKLKDKSEKYIRTRRGFGYMATED